MPTFRPSISPRQAVAAVLLATLAVGTAARAQPAPRAVDFRFAPPYWYSALGVPEDWHKPLANDVGALLYDFGPGPYVIPLTVVGIGAQGVTLTRGGQTLAHPRVPVLSTTLTGPATRVEVTTFSVVPDSVAGTNGRLGAYERLDGISGALGWATPTVPADSAFRNVAWGITRPVHYRVRVEPGASKRVVLGFAESYKPRLGERVAWMRVEGAADQTADLALTARRSEPQVFVFAASDADSDGWIHVEVMAPTGSDPNTTLAALWVYPQNAGFTRDHLIAGTGGTPPELRIAAGTESLHQAPRVDVMDATFSGSASVVPQVTVRTRRPLHVRDGALWLGDRPFVATQPAFAVADTTGEGWTLTLPAGTREVRTLVFSGDARDADLRRARAERTPDLLAASAAYWRDAPIPYGRVTVPDAGVQAVLDESLRTLYQSREVINGRGQFNSGYSLYRGLWTGDAVYHIDLAAMLGDRANARQTLTTLLDHQGPDGLIEVMKPFVFWRESAMTLWIVARYARLVQSDPAERAFVDQNWPVIMRTVEALRRVRETTVGTGEPYDGLFPPAFNDGGIGQITAEYSSVLWALTGLHELGRVAREQGRTDDARRIEAFYTDLRASFDAASRRDMRTDPHGNRYLPVPVAKEGPDATPQLAQWAALEAHLYTDIFPLDGEFLTGTLGIMQVAERQGLPISTGWLPGGVWAGFGFWYGMDLMITGHDDRAIDVFYAMANHASPVGTWVEEQPLVGEGSRLAGDMPHTWHPTVFAHMAIAMLAFDRGDDLHLLGAVPEQWLVPGGRSTLENIQTIAGPVTLALSVSRDGQTATLTADPVGAAGRAGQLLLHTQSLRRAGFDLASGAEAASDEAVVLPWGRPVRVVFRRR